MPPSFCPSCLIHVCDMAHAKRISLSLQCCQYARFHMTRFYVWHDLFTCVTWLIPDFDLPQACLWHGSIVCVPWPIHMCTMTHSYVWHDSFMCTMCLTHTCHMTLWYVWHDSFTQSHVTHMNETRHTREQSLFELSMLQMRDEARITLKEALDVW